MFPILIITLIAAFLVGGLSIAALAAALRIEKQQQSHFELLSQRLRTVEQRVLKLLGHFSKATAEPSSPRSPSEVANQEATEKAKSFAKPTQAPTADRPAASGPTMTPARSQQPSQPATPRRDAVQKPSPGKVAAFENGTGSKPDQPKPSADEPKPVVVAVVEAEVVPEKESAGPTTTSPPRPVDSSRPYTVPQVPAGIGSLEARTKEVLDKIWNWIIVGEEYRREGVAMEYAIATNWLIRIGALILVVGFGFLLKFLYDKDVVTPSALMGLFSVIGLGIVAGGTFFLRRKQYHLLGQGLVGIGITTLYLTVFASMQYFKLIDQTPAFLLMGVITCMACGIAYKFDTLLVALMGVIGGYLTPILLSTGVVNLPGLLAYLSILTAGVLALSYAKDWHLLRGVSLFGTWGLTIAALAQLWPNGFEFEVVMPFIIGFFIMFSTMNFLYNLLKRQEATLLELSMIWVNAVTFFLMSYVLFEMKFGVDDGLVCCKHFAVVTLGMALFYTGHIFYFLYQKIEDRVLLSSFFAIASFMLTITIPILVSKEWLAVSWAVQAVTMLWVAQKLDSRFLEAVANVLYMIVFVMFFVDLGRHFLPYGVTEAETGNLFWFHLTERLLTFGTMVGSFFGGAWLLNHKQKSIEALRVAGANNWTPSLERPVLAVLMNTVCVCLGFLYLNIEVYKTFNHIDTMLTTPAITTLWVGLTAFLLVLYLRHKNNAIFSTLAVAMVALFSKFIADMMIHWGLDHHLAFAVCDAKGFMIRLYDFGIIASMFVGIAWFLRNSEKEKDYQQNVASTVGAIVLLFLYTSLELNSTLYHVLPEFRMGGISILWSLYALAFIVIGIWKDIRALRYTGLALFGIVSLKVFFVDLTNAETVYRIIAFIVLGIILICGSLTYMKCRRLFQDRD